MTTEDEVIEVVTGAGTSELEYVTVDATRGATGRIIGTDTKNVCPELAITLQLATVAGVVVEVALAKGQAFTAEELLLAVELTGQAEEEIELVLVVTEVAKGQAFIDVELVAALDE